MATFYIGQIIIGGWNFAPIQTALSNGQLMSISQNQALFAVLGTTFGGDGVQTFALPNQQGRRMVHWGNGLGLSGYNIGQVGGSENVTANVASMPAHSHVASFANNNSTFSAAGATNATAAAPAAGAVLGQGKDLTSHGVQPAIYVPSGSVSASTTVAMGGVNVAGTVTLGVSGGSAPMSVLNPFNVVTMCTVLFGIFPSRN